MALTESRNIPYNVRLVVDALVVEAVVIFIRPFDAIWNQLVPDEEATVTRLVVSPAIPCMESFDPGVEEPIPTLPLDPILKYDDVAPTADVVDETSKRSPIDPAACMIEKRAEGVVVPTATFPLARIENIERPDDDATLKSARLEVEVARMLKTYEDEVALIPVNTPLSIKVEVPRVVAESQRVA